MFRDNPRLPQRRTRRTPLTTPLTTLLTGALIFATVLSASAQLPTPPRQPHDKSLVRALSAVDGELAPRIVFKLHEGTGVRLGAAGLYVEAGYPQITNPWVPSLDRRAIEADLAAVGALAAAQGYGIAPLIDAPLADLLQSKAEAEASWGHEVADLSLYFQIVMPDWGLRRPLVWLVSTLNGLESLEIAYAEPVALPPGPGDIQAPVPDPTACTSNDITLPAPDFEPDQVYLDPAPIGIDAAAAWALPGGRGAGIRIIDIEGGYGDHVDHPPLLFTTGKPYNLYLDHSRMVNGILRSLDNGVGTTGIASDSALAARSIYSGGGANGWAQANTDSANVAYNIFWAGMHSIHGVVLIELQRPLPGNGNDDCPCGTTPYCKATPVEFWPADFDAIQNATGKGAVVVEASANGSQDLDSPYFQGAFDRQLRDSGAVLTSGSKALIREPFCGEYGHPNYGSRVDVHSWGEQIVTTGTANPKIHDDGACNSYTEDFGGSSGASAIVAGVVASLQGVAEANLGQRLAPLVLRDLLVATGTPQAGGMLQNLHIGPQPDLAAAIAEILP